MQYGRAAEFHKQGNMEHLCIIEWKSTSEENGVILVISESIYSKTSINQINLNAGELNEKKG